VLIGVRMMYRQRTVSALLVVAGFVAAAITGCRMTLNEDLSPRRVDSKLSNCLLANGIDNYLEVTHYYLKKCILREIGGRSGTDLRAKLTAMGFVCEYRPALHCRLASRQRLYGMFSERFNEISAIVELTAHDDSITALSIEESWTSWDGKGGGPVRTDASVPFLIQ
jgi:hypothetical protein